MCFDKAGFVVVRRRLLRALEVGATLLRDDARLPLLDNEGQVKEVLNGLGKGAAGGESGGQEGGG